MQSENQIYTDMIKDYKEIKEVVMQYVNGCATGDVELAKKAFHKNAIMYGYLNGELCAGSIDALYAAISQLGAAPETKYEVDVMEVVGTAATVCVVLEDWHGLGFTDFHSLVKMDGKWQIVAKIFHQ
ncbi:nuclear transport factor 2 family protein [Bacteroides acidifaciens]|uniref:nuclear transport factor 2 family protein n=1 Tax=Bacteroides acidifaciens TaxID=85831 RepID=UPI0025925992|nr:nuclear transport factor 2 family protein [Bacteroides acidifaciens]